MIEPILKALNDSGIPYCILHDWQFLPSDLPSDLDLIIAPENLNTLEKALYGCDGVRVVQLLQYEGTGYYFVLAVQREDGVSFVQVDVATDYRIKGYIFFTAEQLLEGRRLWKNIWVSSPQVEFKYLLVKKIMKGTISEYQKNRVEKLVFELGEEAEFIVIDLFGRTAGKDITSLVSDSDWDILQTQFSRFRKALLRQELKRDPLNPVRFLISELKRIKQRLIRPTGLFIAVLGSDGAGKSTLIRNLRENLTPAFRRNDSFHFRPRVIGQGGSKEPVTAPHAKPPYPVLLSMFKILIYFLDYSLGYLCKVRPKLSRSSLVLFDRYYDDLLVDPLRYRYGGPLWLARFARRCIPEPDLFLVLDVPVETLIERKDEVSMEELKRQRNEYRQLALKLGNAVILNGSLAAEEVLRNGIEASLDYLQRRNQSRHRLWINNEKSESLIWLSSVLFDSPGIGFSPSDSPGSKTEIQPENYESFGWLSLKDGKEYLLPLRSRWKSLNAMDLYNPQRWSTLAVKKIFALGLKSNISRFFIKKVRITIQSDIPTPDLIGKSLMCHIKEILGENELSFAVFLGTPSPHCKPVIQAITSNGKTLAYIKVGWNQTTNDLVRREADMLNRLKQLSFKFMVIPSLLYSGWWQGRFICIQSPPEEKTSTAPRNLTPQYTSVLEEIKSCCTRLVTLKKSAFMIEFIERTEQVSSSLHRHLLKQGMALAEKRIGDRLLPFHPCHGDFAPWNTYLLKDRLFLFDWEYSNFEGVPGWDISHFLIQTKILIKNQSPDKIYSSLQKNELKEPWIKKYMDGLNLEIEMFSSLFLLCLLDKFAFHVTCEYKNLRVIKTLGKLISLFLLEEEFIQ